MNRFKITLFVLFIGYTMYAQKNRTFMFVGEPNAIAWQYMLDNPTDRKEVVSNAFQKLGGKILSYYFGLGDGKNYIICELPNDNELIQAVYLMRLPTGLLKDYKIIELMSSNDMSKAIVKSKELIELEKAKNGGISKK